MAITETYAQFDARETSGSAAARAPAAGAAPQRPLVRLPPSADGAPARTEARAGSCFLGLRVSLCCWRSAWASPSATSPEMPRRSRSSRAPARRMRKRLLARSPQHELFKIQHVLNADEAHKGFRLGKFDLVIEPDAKGGLQYRYDPARPESVLAKAEVNDALQSAAGRKDVVATSAVTSSEPGSRYIDFLIPGLLGHEPDELRHVGHRFRAGRHAPAQAAQALRGHAHAPRRFSAGHHDQPPVADGD